ncbi:MAG TPA: transglutaminase domain-containing protein, partial [Dehalococcoidales bacterium]|nr:transglutaminase domain-containing protein [Dehalococcoidales bacterium]
AKTLTSTTPNENSLFFSIFLILVTWFWGFFGTWRFLKRKSIWIPLFFGMIIILVNLAFLTKAHYYYFYLYLLISLFLLGFDNFIKQQQLKPRLFRLNFRMYVWAVVILAVFGGALVLLTSIGPDIKSKRLRTFYEVSAGSALQLDHLRFNIFMAIGAKDVVVKSREQQELRFSSRPNLGDEVQFHITSTGVPNYWRTRRFDVYNSWGWSNSPYESMVMGSGESQPPSITPAEKYNISYTVTNKIRTDVVITSGKYLFANIPTIINYHERENPDVNVFPDDNLVSVSTTHTYQVDDSYVVNSEIIKPTIDQLKNAGANYPAWITRQYLQLPADLPQSIVRLSRNVIRDQRTEYDKVSAVVKHISQMKYVPEGTFPQENQDGVADFLFVQGAGNCTNFASSAVVMLRTVGVPARFCTGFIPQYVDKSRNTFVVLAKNYHAWIEVYFPGYGWIEFEVTPGAVESGIIPEDTEGFLPGLSTAALEDFPDYLAIFPPPDLASGTPNANIPSDFTASRAVVPVVVVMVLLVGMLWLSRIWQRKMRRKDLISGIMARIHFLSPSIGVSFQANQTAQDYANSLAEKLPKHGQEISYLTQLFHTTRYSRTKYLVQEDERLLNKYWRSIFWGIARRAILRF